VVFLENKLLLTGVLKVLLVWCGCGCNIFGSFGPDPACSGSDWRWFGCFTDWLWLVSVACLMVFRWSVVGQGCLCCARISPNQVPLC
jgi:hypothetical protein